MRAIFSKVKINFYSQLRTIYTKPSYIYIYILTKISRCIYDISFYKEILSSVRTQQYLLSILMLLLFQHCIKPFSTKDFSCPHHVET